MFKQTAIAPAQIMSMSVPELAAYNKQQTKKFIIRVSVIVFTTAAVTAGAEILANLMDKKLAEHYAAKN